MGFVAAVAKFLALVIAAVAAIAAGLIVMPALTMKMALLAIVASEKSALIAAAAVVSLPLAFFGFTRGRRMPSAVAVVLAVAADAGPRRAGDSRRLLVRGRERRSDAAEPAPRRPWVHGVRRAVPDHAAAE